MREIGYYWIRFRLTNREWTKFRDEIAEWDGNDWFFIEDDCSYQDFEIEISEISDLITNPFENK